MVEGVGTTVNITGCKKPQVREESQYVPVPS